MHDALFQGLAIAALLAGNALLVALGFLAARLLYPASKPEANQEPRDPQQDLKGIALSLATVSERLVKLEVQIGQLRGPSGGPGLPLNRDADQKFFKVATKLALQGASVEEVMELCGLSRGEADLICMLHANNQVSPSSIAAESVQQLTARMAASAEALAGETAQASESASLRRVG